MNKIKIIKNKFEQSNNRDKFIIAFACSIIVMLVAGSVFRVIGLDNFLIDKNVDIEYSGKYKRLYDSILLWINTGFILIFSLREYNTKIIPKLIFLFPIIYFINNFDSVLEYNIGISILPFCIISIIKFDWKTIKRAFLIFIISAILQLTSGFIKYSLFSLNPSLNTLNAIYTLLYSIDLYISYIIILFADRNEVIK